jgi:hypothetical protein
MLVQFRSVPRAMPRWVAASAGFSHGLRADATPLASDEGSSDVGGRREEAAFTVRLRVVEGPAMNWPHSTRPDETVRGRETDDLAPPLRE